MLDNVIVRLVLHYIATFLFFSGIWLLFPEVAIYIAEEKVRSSAAAFSAPHLGANPRLTLEESHLLLREGGVFHPQTFVPVSLSLLFSFLYALPVTWVYRWTRPRKQYSQAFAHTLLVVPIAIALVVFLVKDSLALAFSLAGIVAAVRFRTTLSEPMDATYMFIVIGIGLAAGIQLGGVAILASLAFNAVVLGVWRMNYGAEPAILSGFRRVYSAPAPKPKPHNAKLKIHATQLEEAQQAAVALLATYAKRWRQVGIVQQENGPAIVEFDVRLKKTADPVAFVRALEKGAESHTAKVELETREGL